MPEHTNDPIQDLEDFGTGGLTVTPLDAAQVRRLGDRRRNRRRGTIAIAAAVVAIAGTVTPIALLSGSDSSRPPITHTPSPSPTQTNPSRPSPSEPTATAPSDQDITYPEGGIEITNAADTDELVGTSEAFRTFIAAQADLMVKAGASCPDAFHGVVVQKYSPQGYALGGLNDCGGVAALWAEYGGQWQDAGRTQDAFNCDTLEYLSIPKSFTGGCVDEAGDFGPTQAERLRLGMTAAEVVAAGGRELGRSSSAGCHGIVVPGRTPVTDLYDGWLSPDGRLVAITARLGTTTPEKIGLGSAAAAVKAAYPNGQMSANGYWTVPLTDGSQYEFGIGGLENVVTEMLLSDPGQQCYG